VDVYVRTARGASVTTVAHYKTTDNQKTAAANGAAQATIAHYVSGATARMRGRCRCHRLGRLAFRDVLGLLHPEVLTSRPCGLFESAF
jgi:hypothetical protein